MNPQLTLIEKRLKMARLRWEWLRFLRDSSILGIILCLLGFGLGGAIFAGVLETEAQALQVLAVLAGAGLIAWLVLTTVLLIRPPGRPWLAAALERADGRLQDRLNTLVFLEKHRQMDRSSFGSRIAEQARRVLEQTAPPSPFSSRSALAWFGCFLMVLGATLLLNQRLTPWKHLHAQRRLAAGQGTTSGPHSPLVLPTTNSVELNQAWGEIRITDPGADLRVTKVDVVPLLIEAAANRTLKEIAWCSSVNGNPETAHGLPVPADPHYAVYHPMIYLDEMGVSDWDVMTYYARARSETNNSYASEVYFVEIQPFREDILKLPGGQGGQAYATLNETSSLINRQQHVIRETHQKVQQPAAQPKLHEQEVQKLAQTEGDLSRGAKHLYAEMAATMENQPIGEALDSLAKAETSLGEASSLLQNNVMGPAQERERAALSELVSARKIFQRAVSDHPSDFAPPQDEPAPIAGSSKKLNQMAEFRDEEKSAQEFVQKTLDQQKDLEQRSESGPPEHNSQLSGDEERLGASLNDFAEQHPRPFKGSENEMAQARQAMQQAAESLRNQGTEAAGAAQEATQGLEKLKSALQNRSAGQQLADAYRLKKMLDQEIQTLERHARSDAKGSEQELADTARAAQQTIDQLKKAIDQPGNRAFGQPLRDALGDPGKEELEEKLARLQEAQDEAERRDSASSAEAALQQLSKAFAASEPKSLQAARQADSLQPGEESHPTEPPAPAALKDDRPDLVNIDPARLPVAYRSRIEKYFRKLSENSAK